MVSRFPFLILPMTLFAALFLFGKTASAETELNLSVDKSKLYQNEILNLTVQVNSALDLSLGGLMNFGGAQIESPSFEDIEQDWDIIDKQQSYNMQSINGQTQSMITWRYALSPKRSGFLQIPKATFQDATSSPINIEVIGGNRPLDESNPPAVFLKASIDKPSPYLQEQVIYTLELYTLGEARGDMSEPSHPDLIIESLGETSKTYKMRFNRRYEVYERRYLLFPQKSGPLTVSAQEFSGTVVDTRTRRRGRARELSNDITLQVRQPPASFSGDTWLPATSLFINEAYEPNATEIKQGDSITRKVNITTLGLLASALPELPAPSIDGMKIYPDQPQVNASEHAQGVQSTRLETQAMVAITPGEYTLPSIELKWWDTINDRERTATVPERTITILPSQSAAFPEKNIADSSQQQALEQDKDLPQLETDPLISQSSDSDSEISQQLAADPVSTYSQLWLYTTLVTLVLWALHAAFLYRRLNRQRAGQHLGQAAPNSGAASAIADLSQALITAAKSNDRSLALKARHWFSQLDELAPQTSKAISAEFKELVSMFEALHFSPDSKQINDQTRTRFIALVKEATVQAEKHQTERADKNSRSSKGLKPFYPA